MIRVVLHWLPSTQLGSNWLTTPPNSPDLAPSDFFLFPKLKENIRGKIFTSDDDVMTSVKDWFEDQSSNFFLNGLPGLEHRRMKCIEVDGNYV